MKDALTPRPLPVVEGAPPRPSASVILGRDGPDGLESFMVRRHARSPVAPSAYVFPGGTVRAEDHEISGVDLGHELSARSDTPVSDEEAAAFYVCAIRELFEEAGVLLVTDVDHRLLTVAAHDMRHALQAGQLTLAGILAENRWQPAFGLLVPFSHWITPRALAARFDTRFFVAVVPPDQSALHDTIETSEGVWLSPARVLEGDYHTVYATAQHLRRLAPFASVKQLMDFAHAKPIRMVSPEMVEAGDGVRVYIKPELFDAW